MNDEIESLYALLGVKPDEASVSDSVDKLVKAVQSKLNSSIYGGENGVITLPATLEGKFKNGKEINQEIKDAYAAIYKKAQQMADKSVSLTLKDIEDFKAQIDKFSKKTAKYKGSDIIANANNNLRQMLSDYQDFVNGLRKQASVQQKAQIKQTQKAKAQAKANKKQKGYIDTGAKITNENIEGDIKNRKLRLMKGLKSVLPKGYGSGWINPSSTNDYESKHSEISFYGSKQARQVAQSAREARKWERESLTVDKYDTKEKLEKELAKRRKEDPKFKQSSKKTIVVSQDGKMIPQDVVTEWEVPKSTKPRELSPTEKAGSLSEDIRNNILPELIDKIKTSTDDKEVGELTEKFFNTLEAISKLNQDAGKLIFSDVKKDIGIAMGKLGFTTDGKIGGIDAEEGTDKTAASKDPRIEALMRGLLDKIAEKQDAIKQELIKLEQLEKQTTKTKATKESNSFANRIIAEVHALNASQKQNSQAVAQAVAKDTKATNTQTVYDKNANVKQDTDAAKEIKIEQQNADINRDTAGAVKRDESTGFNTNERADIVIDLLRQILSAISGNAKQSDFLTLPPAQEMKKVQETAREAFKNALKSGASYEEAQQKAADVSNKNKQKNTKSNEPITNGPVPPKRLTGFVPPSPEPEPYKNKVDKSHIYASPIKTTVWDTLAKAFEHLTGVTKEYEATMQADAEEQDRMAAERIKTWGMNNGRNPNDTGDIAGMRRILQLYRTNKASIEQNPELRQKIKLTGGRDVDTTAITKALNKVLSGKQMRNAQMGGSPLRQIAGAFTGFIGMPSIEKSRAQADGLNQILGNINRALQSVLSDIQRNETELAGMEKTEQVQFDDQGYIAKGSSAAYKTLADLEEHKVVLDSILADMNMVDQVVDQTDGKFTKLVRRLSFTSPVLRENNDILRNINAGLDKSGKALKFQTRLSEILNYTFQLIGRSIGQWFKRIISMLNPLNIIKNIAGKIKSVFQDFGSYDTKWQRTMNVIKINFQRAIKPAMEWIAQKLVNIIGFFNIISMKVQEAFGQVPVDLFDQAGANAEKMRRELEKAANVTAGFDELHDIGSDNSGENDLLGDIYKPQLSDEWKAIAEEIGDLFAGLIKGEKTVGEVFGRIFEMLLDLLGKIAKAIWDWFKQTSLGKWITEHWKGLLATLLALFLGWQLLKIFGPTLLSTIGGAFKTLLIKVGGWMTTLLGASGFGQGIMLAFQSLFAGGKYSLLGTLGEMFTNSAAITQAGSWGSMIGFAVTKGLLAALTGYATYRAINHFGDNLADKTSYNLGVEYAGGKDEDKKSKTLNTIGAIGSGVVGGAATGAIIGGVPGAVIGAAIGGVAGTIQTVLRPALEEAEVAARNLNGELQSVSFNEAQVQTFQEQSNALSEQLDILKQSLETSTQSVYKQGEELGISKTRMDELVKSTQDGTFNTGMLSGAEMGLADSLTDLTQKQEHYTNVSKEAEEAERKLLKAKTELAIAEDIEAGNFEIAAARIELAEAQKVYSTEEATDRRIELFEKCADEERANLLQDLTPDQKKRMTDLNNLTDTELAKLNTAWQDSSEVIRDSILSGLDENTQSEFKRRMNQIDTEIESHKGFWQSIGDTLAEIFSFGHVNTWTYNGDVKYEDEVRKGKIKIQKNALGTNYVEADGLQYLHQGEAIIPKKYNQPYQPQNNSGMESAINNLVQQVAQISNQVNQGIPVKGQFVQRGSDLVATVERANNRIKNNVLNNRVYAR